MSSALDEIARDLTLAVINAKTASIPANVNDPQVVGVFVGRMYRHILRELHAGHDEPRADVPAV